MSERTSLLLLGGGCLIVDGVVAWLTWGTPWLLLCLFITVFAIMVIVVAFVDGGGEIDGDGGVGLGI
ncbi:MULTISPECIES: hypothetical protein [unclassified Streptomyces]|uniref:hypothetical protein n=1 Tax=unclassified Streptomyces TaxID=2593676 RepID=UPI000B818136|nr:hypothetical protein [Streptomyces sp. MnatMP-M77]MYT80225.1 hypothetical protein [Streptomyces sp. SID8364]